MTVQDDVFAELILRAFRHMMVQISCFGVKVSDFVGAVCRGTVVIITLLMPNSLDNIDALLGIFDQNRP